jgi:predicted nucleic acid-binding Zn ribbon protein
MRGGRRRWYDPLTRSGGASQSWGTRQGADAPTAVGGVLDELVTRREWHRRLEGSRIHDCWAQIAGDMVAAHVRPVRLLGGVLVLEADSGAWATQVRYLSQTLADRANEVLDAPLVEQVQVVTARPRRR